MKCHKGWCHFFYRVKLLDTKPEIMNYRIHIETGYWDAKNHTNNLTQHTLVLIASEPIDIKYVKNLVHQKYGDKYDTLDIVIERIEDNFKF